jgi:phage terminase large subunit-like protein
MAESLAQIVAALPEEERLKILEGTDPEALLWDWRFWARPEQIAPEGDWAIWLLLAGRGFGKTRTAAEWVREEARVTNTGKRRFALVARTAADVRDVLVEGEALALDTLVATPSGFVRMGDIQVGDIVIGGDGLPCTVTTVFPVLENRPCFLLDISGVSIVADANHKWTTSTHVERNYEARMPRVYEGVRTTEQLSKSLTVEKGYPVSNHAVRIVPVVGTYSDDLPVSPYTLGLWLGDGTAKGATITSHTDDQSHVRARVEADGYTTTDNKTRHTFGVTKGLLVALRSANVLKNKHIPEEYFHASLDQRMALLHGLMDSDGTISVRGQAEFDNTNKVLIDGVARLVAGLGIKHGGVKYREGGRKISGTEYAASNAYRITFTTSLAVTSLPRKSTRTKKYRSEEKWRYVKSVVPVASVPVRCIAVDSPDNTFLVTEQYVRTHNSGIMNISSPSEMPLYEPSKRRLTWPNGNTATCFTADEPDSLRGPQFTHAWGDEVAAWRQTPDAAGMTAFDNLRVGTRLGANPKILITTTPKRVPLLYSLLKEAENNPNKVRVSRGSTMDNAGNLAESYIDAITGVYAGTRLASQELYGEMLDAAEGALWSDEIIADYRQPSWPSDMPLRCVAVDPSVAENPKDECGIVVVGSTAERDLYKRQAWVLEDATVHGSPTVWAEKVVHMARKWGCPVVAEVNQGGALVKNAILTIDPNIKVLEVHSKFGKALRAEPITLAYEQGRVHHVGYFAELESQMTSWAPGESKSPDRIDALVHGLTALLIKPPQGFVGGQVTARSAASRRMNIGRSTQGGGSGRGTFRVR